jgi:hypothetical protein
MTFFGGFLAGKIKENEHKAGPMVEEIVKGIRENKPGAVDAAKALGRILDDFLVEPK